MNLAEVNLHSVILREGVRVATRGYTYIATSVSVLVTVAASSLAGIVSSSMWILTDSQQITYFILYSL